MTVIRLLDGTTVYLHAVIDKANCRVRIREPIEPMRIIDGWFHAQRPRAAHGMSVGRIESNRVTPCVAYLAPHLDR